MKKRTTWGAIALTMMAATVATSCDNDESGTAHEPTICPVVTPTSLELTLAEQQMVEKSDEFAFSFFRQAQSQKAGQILSPISIIYALGMLNNGATGETQAQISKVLGFEATGADGINAFCRKMLSAAPTLDPLTKVMMANTIFMNKDYKLKEDFAVKARNYYDATPETRDFHDGQTLGLINQWAADHTEQMIKEVLNEGNFSPEAVSYLLNAIYFKGQWATKFDKSQTADEPFMHAGDSKEMTFCKMMHQQGPFSYAENDTYQALVLPYGNGTYTMTVLLPKKAGNELPPVPTAAEWQQLNRDTLGRLVDVKLPRMVIDTDIKLNNIMSRLGMTRAFDPDKAEFPNFCDSPTYIGMMKQTAKLIVDEEGTEAAAVTVIGMITTSVGEEPSYTNFHANHPFLYIISERRTGAIFFIGQYTGY